MASLNRGRALRQCILAMTAVKKLIRFRNIKYHQTLLYYGLKFT